MKKIILTVLTIMMLLFATTACGPSNMIETESTIVNKVAVDSYNYQLLVTYEIDGVPGYEATIKVTKREFDQYQIGDTYTFKRPAP